jgi:hypothetical protein
MVVDAKDSIAYAFYRKFGFESLKDDTNPNPQAKK